MKRIPSRWSVSCWIARASSSVPSITTGSPCMSKPFATTRNARVVVVDQAREGQAALFALLLLVRQVEARVHEVAEDAVDVVREDAQADADLRRGEAGAGRVHHRLLEVLDEDAQLLVEVGDGLRGRAQHRVAEKADRLDGHGTPRCASAAGAQVRGRAAAGIAS